MPFLNCLRPRQLEERGTQQESEARKLFGIHGANLTRSNYEFAETFLDQ